MLLRCAWLLLWPEAHVVCCLQKHRLHTASGENGVDWTGLHQKLPATKGLEMYRFSPLTMLPSTA